MFVLISYGEAPYIVLSVQTKYYLAGLIHVLEYWIMDQFPWF